MIPDDFKVDFESIQTKSIAKLLAKVLFSTLSNYTILTKYNFYLSKCREHSGMKSSIPLTYVPIRKRIVFDRKIWLKCHKVPRSCEVFFRNRCIGLMSMVPIMIRMARNG